MTKSFKELLKEQLPAFDVHEDFSQDIIRVGGHIYLGYQVSEAEFVRFASPSEAGARAAYAERIAHETRLGAIKGLNMQPMLDAMTRSAEARGRAAGREEGYIAGHSAGYGQGMAAFALSQDHELGCEVNGQVWPCGQVAKNVEPTHKRTTAGPWIPLEANDD